GIVVAHPEILAGAEQHHEAVGGRIGEQPRHSGDRLQTYTGHWIDVALVHQRHLPARCDGAGQVESPQVALHVARERHVVNLVVLVIAHYRRGQTETDDAGVRWRLQL